MDKGGAKKYEGVNCQSNKNALNVEGVCANITIYIAKLNCSECIIDIYTAMRNI